MVSPRMAENEALEFGRIYAQAERDVISRIANKLSRDKTASISQWELTKLNELRKLRSGIEMHIGAKLDNFTDKELRRAIEQAYKAGMESAVTDLARVLPDDEIPVKAGFAQIHQDAVRAQHQALAEKLKASHFRIVRQANDVYRTAVRRGVEHVLTGAGTRLEGAQLVLNEFANRGVTGFIDSAGRSWDLASYAEMSIRTNVGQAAVQGHINRLQDNGRDLVYVSGHEESCPICDPWEGEILSISGEDERYPSVADAEADGLFHPNCAHNLTAYIEGLTETDEPEPGEEDYEERQEQRYNERQIRKWKRREAAAMTEKAQAKSKQKVREWQGRQAEFTEKTGRRRKYGREQITQAR